MQLARASRFKPMFVMRTAFLGCFVALTLASIPLRAQSTVPTLSQAIPGQTLSPGGASVTVDVRNHFIVPGVVGTQFARFDTVLGAFGVELRNDVAPRHVANFLAYAQANAYTNTFIHRSYSFDNAAVSIVQGGGYRAPLPVSDIPRCTCGLLVTRATRWSG